MTTKSTSKKPKIKLHNRRIVMVPRSELKHHPHNVRQGDVGALVQLFTENGYYGALIVQRSTGYVIKGNHSMDALDQLDVDPMPVLWLDVDDATARRMAIADNRATDLATNDQAALADELRWLREQLGSLDGTGFDDDDLDELQREIDRTLREVNGEGKGDGSAQLGDMQYRIIVDCESEQQQAELLERFESEGLTCQALMS